MKVYAQRQNQPQQRLSTSLTRRPLAASSPTLHLQHPPGNQGAQQSPRANDEGLEARSGEPATARFAHDFSRIPVLSKAPVELQAKRAANTAGDAYEREADEVSEQVTRMSEPQLQRACAGGCPERQAEQRDPEHTSLQTKSAASSDAGRAAAPPLVDEALASPGRPLDPATRRFMEPRFGYDFSRVRVHSGAPAERSARSLSAKAYTVGHDIVFGSGRFAPGTHEGQRLLAHELAHVVQQSRGGAPRPSLDGTGPLERAAEHASAQAFSGDGPVEVRGAAAPGPMCQPDEEGGEEETSPRQLEKERTQRRKQERALAGKQGSDLTRAQAEQELRALEESYRQPGAQARSMKRKLEDLRRYEKLLDLTEASVLEKNKRKGTFDELQRTPTATAGKPQTKHVAGGAQLPGQDLRPGQDPYAQPDYTIERRRRDGSIERIHVNLKSDKIDVQTPAQARATARAYLAQAVKNSKHLADGESIVISFARTPSADVQQAVQQELFVKGSPVSEVRFGSTTYKRENYTPPAAPARPAATKRKATKAKTATPKPTPKAKKPAARPAAVRPTAPRPAAATPAAAGPAAAAPAPTVKPATVKTKAVRPVAPKTAAPAAPPKSASPGRGSRTSGVRGRGVGVLISLAASFIASEAQAAVEEDRFTKGYGVDSRAIETEVNEKLTAMAHLFVEHHVRRPDTPLYANVTICVHTFDGYVVAGDEAITWTDYEGTSLEGVRLETAPVEKTRVERDGSAGRGGSDTYRYITYPVQLASPPIEDIAMYARLHGMDLTALRTYAAARREEVARLEGGSTGAKMSAHWSNVLSMIDADDTDLVLRAHMEQLPVEDVRDYLSHKAKSIMSSIDAGAYPREQGALGRLLAQAEKASELLALLDAPFEDVVDYAKKNGKQLAPLGDYAVRRATKAREAGANSADSTYWSQMVRYIDNL